MTMTTQFVEVTKYIYRVKCWLNWIKSVSQSVPTWINMFSLDFLFPGINSSDNENMEEEWVRPKHQPTLSHYALHSDVFGAPYSDFIQKWVYWVPAATIIYTNIVTLLFSIYAFRQHIFSGDDTRTHSRTCTHTLSHAMREAHHIYLLILISRKGIKLWQKTREDKNNKQSNIYLLLLLSCTCIQLHIYAYTHSAHTHTNVVRYTILYENFVMKFIEMGFYRNQFRIYLYL